MSTTLERGSGKTTGKKVLIVDDEYLIRYAMQKLVEHEGCFAFTAGCGNDALHVFIEQDPDVIILDIGLPDTNGLVLLKTIKHFRPSVAIIMATGCPDAEGNAEAMRLGALAYLEKPVDMNILKKLMCCTKQTEAQIQ